MNTHISNRIVGHERRTLKPFYRAVHPVPARSAYINGDVISRFGARLRKLRKQHGWTQLQLSEYLGINRSYISDLERGKKSAGLGTLEIIAIGFNISLSSLLEGI
ncbi:MAG: helix-turn-helix domain-containing protein [Acidobacteriaceae bacterium]